MMLATSWISSTAPATTSTVAPVCRTRRFLEESVRTICLVKDSTYGPYTFVPLMGAWANHDRCDGS